LRKFRVQFEETTDAHEKEVKNLNNQILDISRQKEGALREVGNTLTPYIIPVLREVGKTSP